MILMKKVMILASIVMIGVMSNTSVAQEDMLWPDISVNPTALNFGYVVVGDDSSQVVTVTNVGQLILNVTSTSIGDTVNFSIVSGGGSFTLEPFDTRDVTIRFNPDSIGVKLDTLRIQSDDPDENPKDVPLVGTAGEPDIAVNPADVRFWNVNVGTTGNQVVTVTNEGPGILNVTSTDIIDSGNFSVVSGGAPFTLLPLATRDVTIQFGPASAGVKLGTLRVQSNDPDEDPLDVPLWGNATVPDIAVNPVALDFGEVVIGSDGSLVVTVTNEGNGILNVASTELIDSGDFSVTSGGGSFTLAPAGTRDVTVRFAPGSVGVKAGTLRFQSNDPDEDPKDVPMTGNGILPDIAADPAAVDFGDVVVGSTGSRVVTVTNEGVGDLNVRSTELIDSGNFSILSGGGSFTLAPAAAREVTVQFAPGAVGVMTGTLRFQSNDPDEDPKDVPLTGNGTIPDIAVDPAALDFGDVAVGTDSSRVITVANEGTADLNVTVTHIIDSGNFSVISGGGPFTLAPSAVRDVTVRFNPGSIGLRVGLLRFMSNDPDENPVNVPLSGNGTIPDIAVDPAVLDFGSVVLGSTSSRVVTVTNEGTADLNVMSADIIDSGDFSVTLGGAPFTLAPAAGRDVTVQYGPGSAGAATGTLRFQSNDPDENPVDVPLSGNAAVPDIAVDPAALDFGSVVLGSASSRVVTVTNEGMADLNVTSTDIIDSGNFSVISGGGPFTLAPSAARDVTVQFDPDSFGVKAGTLRFLSNDPDESPYDVPVGGTGISGSAPPPFLKYCFPPDSALAVPMNTPIQFRIREHENGFEIDPATIDVMVNDTLIIANGIPVFDRLLMISPNDSGYTVSYVSPYSFYADDSVTVRVQCEDLAYPANALDSLYTFWVDSSFVSFTKLDTVDWTGGVVVDDLTGIQMELPPGALADSMHIGIGYVDRVPQLPDSVQGVGIPYYFWPDGLSFYDPVTIKLPYTALDFSDLSIENPDELMVYYYSTTRAEWTGMVVTGIDDAGGWIIVQTTELCYMSYAVPAVISTVGDSRADANLPDQDFQLFDNYPNPFNPETTISYEVYKSSNIRIEIFNTIGQRIRQLLDSKQEAGSYEITWNGRDDFMNLVGAGIYVVVAKTEDHIELKKVVFVK